MKYIQTTNTSDLSSTDNTNVIKCLVTGFVAGIPILITTAVMIAAFSL